MALTLLWTEGMQIRLTFEDPPDPEREPLGGCFSRVEVLEGEQEFLSALLWRLDAILRLSRGPLFNGEDTAPVRLRRRGGPA